MKENYSEMNENYYLIVSFLRPVIAMFMINCVKSLSLNLYCII